MSLFPSDPRTKSVIHYIISHTTPEQLGATKLNKVMWRADVDHYKRYGTTITGQSSYIRMPQGPVPNYARESIDELKSEGKITERRGETPVGARREFVWLEKARAEEFTPAQIEVIQEAIRDICVVSAVKASNDTHDTLWDEIENGAQIPIKAASVSPANLEPDDIAWALKNASLMNE